MNPRTAFTLVELAIVLVIIGLIVGGVLVGQDLIKAAQIRATISDIEKYNAAAVTFREKYTGLPGDLLNTKAVQFGFNTAANDAIRGGGDRHGDGDGLLEGCNHSGHGADEELGCETALFWSDLSKARLTGFQSKITSTSDESETAGKTTAELADGILPKSKLRDTALIAAFSTEGRNRFAIGEMITDNDPIAFTGGEGRGLTPLEASIIDRKLDDGEPTTGDIISAYRLVAFPDSVGSDGDCIDDATSHYNTTTDTLATTDACALSIRASF